MYALSNTEETPALVTAAVAPTEGETMKAYTKRVARKVVTNGLIAAGIAGIIFGNRRSAILGGLARLAYDYIVGL